MAGCGRNHISNGVNVKCPLCNSKTYPISFPAVKMIVKEELKELVVADDYYTCDNRDCEVVIFNGDGEQIFLVIDMDMGADFQEVMKDHHKSCGGCGGGCGGCSSGK